ncbi:MAG TPA: polysaccharide biosynthesis tyrosine autokinase [Gemmatimonadales bacterium]|nr:polysaccharide biosynthesis tyrosine autokinase [Gemmatimonadales bacterium]
MSTLVVPPKPSANVTSSTSAAPVAPHAMDDWQRVFAAVRASRWLIVGITAVGTLAGVAAARYLKPTYEARATVWLDIPDRPEPEARNRGPISTDELFGTATGWLDLLRSHVVLDDVVRKWGLYRKPKSADDVDALATLNVSGDGRPGRYRLVVDRAGKAFRLLDLDKKVVLQQGAVGDEIGTGFAFSWVPPSGSLTPGRTIDFTLSTISEAAAKLGAELRIRAVPEGNLVTLAFRGADPDRTTGIVNTVAERFIAAAADLKRQRLTELTAILEDQLDHAQANLRSAEGALTDFRVKNAVRASEGPAQGPDGRRITADPTYASYIDLQVAIDGLERDRLAIARLLTHAADSGVAVDQLAMIGAVQRSSELTAALKELTDRQADLRAMRFRYADTHPPVVRLAAQVDSLAKRIIPALCRTLMAGLATRQREIKQQRDSVARDLRTAPPVALTEIRLARDQTNAEQLFINLQHRYQEARLAEVSTLPDVRVLERAVRPTKPTSNTAPLLIVAAFLTSFGIGVAGAVVRERADHRVRYPDQVSQAMGLPILGAVSHVRQNGKRGWGPFAHHRTPEANAEDGLRAVEAFRGLRLNVHYAAGAATPLLLTVTSPGRGEGKSFVSANLAYAFSAVGYRTLLIDGDVRLGALHRPLRRVRRPGLTDALAGLVATDAVVQTTVHPNLWFIAAGSRMHRGPELLSSEAMPRLLSAFRPSFDVILIDSAPLAAGVDPYAIGTATGNVVVVLRTGMTDRALAEVKVEMLHRLPLRVLGAVLNDVSPGMAYNYYGYSLPGYNIWEEDPTGVASKMLMSEQPAAPDSKKP